MVCFRHALKNQWFMYANLYNMAILKVLKMNVSSLKSMIYVQLALLEQIPLSQGLKQIEVAKLHYSITAFRANSIITRIET